jgi:2-desacetyl-2-hydroxyethyl bacteriochlorophyllide A dehydrogenase
MLALLLDREPRLVTNHEAPARKPGEARLRMRLAGICDTDLQLARGYMSFRGVLGHEFVGQVVEADDVSWIGRRAVADINAGCGRCQECRENAGHHCSTRTVLGILGRDGALAEELVVPERCLVPVPDHVSDDCAVFAEPLAAAAHVVKELDCSRSEPVVVLGDGKLGQLIARAILAADRRVLVVGHHADKLALAAAAGAETRLESELDSRARGAAVVVEATGSATGVQRAFDLVRPRGCVILKTTVAGPIGLELAPLVIDEVRLVGSRCGSMQQAIRLLSEGRVDPRPLIAAQYPLRQAEEALQHAARPGTLKVLVKGVYNCE